MKSIPAFLLAILLTFILVSNASAQTNEGIWLTANTTAYKTGETVIVAVNASATPDGVALVSATIATSADGMITKFVPAPSSNPPEWLSWTRAADVVLTLNPYP